MSPILQNLLKLLDTPRDGALLRFGIANEYVHAQDWAEAEKHLRAALTMQHDYSAAWKLLGKVLASAGQEREALAVYQEGIAVAQAKGDIQAVKEMTVFARRLQKSLGETG
ncbi:tetratricopeptide repeat protein [Pseudogulbenkiania ferrooxidans]|uniref:TPR repeat-containing protein n=1 Tax=Pseudogulbenkiania ferrooxidans 2002 TaxID=279714 RepID=B9YZU8_9NEIS|nr:tetratricopeptide repeat protein [Pseudogulbenkiania ferrooxidans]EEG09831.1 TPR repeat-containing protein [Pseudogulbenkiania ferrooxidans 2002]